MLTEVTEATAAPMAPVPHRRADIQGLRAFAILLVVAFHAGLPLPGGFVGVDVFFVISGFVITGLLVRELDTTGRLSLPRFYARRIRRLLPALALVTTMTAVASMLLASPVGPQQAITAETGWGAILLRANLVIHGQGTGYFSPDPDMNPLLHTWSLSVEEQFYLVFPTLLLAGWIGGRWLLRSGRFGAGGVVAGAAGLSFAISIALSFGLVTFMRPDQPESYAFYSAITRAWEFAAGVVLALAAGLVTRIPRAAARALGLVGVAVVAVGAVTISGQGHFPGWVALLPVSGTVLLLAAGTAGGQVPGFTSRPMTTIGDLSYSWYLWHWPVLMFTGRLWPAADWALPVAAVASLGPAWVSFRYLENPLHHDSRIRGRRVVVLAVVCAAVPALACIGLWLGTRAHWGSDNIRRVDAQVTPLHGDVTTGCNREVAPDQQPPGACVSGRAATGPPIYLLGDSNAGQFTEAVRRAGHLVDSPVTVATVGGCPFLHATGYTEGAGGPTCRAFVAETTQDLSKQPPGIVVLAMASDLVIADPRWTIRADGGYVARSPESKARLWSSSLAASIRALRAAGHRVILVQPLPHFFVDPGELVVWGAEWCPTLVVARNPESCGMTMTVREVAEQQARAVRAGSAAAATGGATVLQLRDRYCPGGVCATNRGGRWLYRDGIHISVPESERLGPRFAVAIQQALSTP